MKKALITYDIELVEIMSGIAAVAWGFWLLNPAFNTFDGSLGYVAMASIAPEYVWSVIMLFVGVMQVYAVVAHKLSYRKRASLALSMMWVFITTMIAISHLASTGVAIYGVFSCFTIWSYLRLSQRVEITSKFSKK